MVAHEVLHVANGHCWRQGPRDPDRWNDACDYAINPIVLSAGMVLPKGALVDARYTGKSAEEIYGLLTQEAKNKQPPAPAAATRPAQAAIQARKGSHSRVRPVSRVRAKAAAWRQTRVSERFVRRSPPLQGAG